jgi:hypothetical protein
LFAVSLIKSSLKTKQQQQQQHNYWRNEYIFLLSWFYSTAVTAATAAVIIGYIYTAYVYTIVWWCYETNVRRGVGMLLIFIILYSVVAFMRAGAAAVAAATRPAATHCSPSFSL